MDEAPSGWLPDRLEARPPRASTSVLISRQGVAGIEVLLCHRIETLRAFPNFWALPGGGVSARDAKAAGMLSSKFRNISPGMRPAAAALLREVVEEIGWAVGEYGISMVSQKQRTLVLEESDGWLNAVKAEKLGCDSSGLSHIATRTTPPFAPLRFENVFWHLHVSTIETEPILLEHRSEFDEAMWIEPAAALTAWRDDGLQLPPPIVTLLRDFDSALMATNHDVASAVSILSKTPAIGSHRIEFAPGVECVPLPTATLPPATHTNCYILGEAGGQRIVVDPAAKSETALAILEERILEVIGDGGEIIATVYTHRHSDHIGDLKRIAEIYQAPIWASQETLELIPKCDSDRTLISGEELSLKGPYGEDIWQVFSTPGHCPGHICLASERGVISADLVSVVGTILVPSSDGDMQQYMDDLETIRSLRPVMLFPAHGPYTPNPDAILQRYIRHRSSRHERVLDAVRTGCSEVTEIAERAYSDTPDADMFLAADQTISHLKSHETARLVQRFGNQWRPHVE